MVELYMGTCVAAASPYTLGDRTDFLDPLLVVDYPQRRLLGTGFGMSTAHSSGSELAEQRIVDYSASDTPVRKTRKLKGIFGVAGHNFGRKNPVRQCSAGLG